MSKEKREEKKIIAEEKQKDVVNKTGNIKVEEK